MALRIADLLQDVRYAWRGIRKSPGFSVTAAVSLALGIGANTAIFTVVHSVLLKPLPFPEPDRLVQLWESQPAKGYSRNVINAINFLDWRERSRSFQDMAAVQTLTTNLTGVGEPVALTGMQVSPGYFSILRVPPAMGRAFHTGEAQVAILNYGLWQSHFGGDPSILGRRITVNGELSTIIGVMPRGFTLPKIIPDIWTPLHLTRSGAWARGRSLTAVGRLKPGVSVAQANEDLHAVAAQSARERPDFNQGWSAEAVPLLEDATEKVRLPLLVLLAAVGLVLLIACANVANLLLMRASSRTREIAVRAALGAGRRRIMQQLLAESLVLAVLASAAGLALGWWGVKALIALVPRQSQLPRLDAIHMDGTALLFTLGLSFMTAAIFGLVPALQVSQIDPLEALQSGSARVTTRSWLRQALVVAEIALSMILLAGAGLMLRSFHRLVSVNPGFATEQILTLEILTSPAKYRENQKRSAYFARLLEDVRSVPGVQSAGSVHFLPLQDRTSGSCFARIDEPPPDVRSAGAEFLVVSPGYFQTMGIALRSGRHFDSRDRFGGPAKIMVNQEFVKRFLQGREPVGQKLNVCWTVANPAEIVGVVADARQSQLRSSPEPTIFVNNVQSPMFFAQLVVRTAGDPAQISRAVQSAMRRTDPDQAVTHVQTMETVLAESVAQPRLQLVLLAVFSALAAVLAMVGIYGVVAYSAARRTREIGIRVALGAAPGDVRRLLLREGIMLGAVGIGIGLAGAVATTRVMRTLLYETTPTDLETMTAAAAAVLMIVLLAILIPTNRAARVSPTAALRYE